MKKFQSKHSAASVNPRLVIIDDSAPVNLDLYEEKYEIEEGEFTTFTTEPLTEESN